MRTVLLHESPYKGVLRSIKTDVTLDENVCILVLSENFQNNDNEWRLISTHTSKKLYYRQIVNISNNSCPNSLVLTHVNFYNLNNCSSSVLLPKVNYELVIENSSQKFIPQYATNTKLAMIESYHKVNISIVDNCLKNYFSKSRYLQANDVVCIPVSQYYPEAYFGEHTIAEDFLYFKVESLEGPKYSSERDNIIYGYYVNAESTTVHQINSTQCYIPNYELESYKDIQSIETIEHTLYSVIPNGMNEICENLEELVLPFLTLENIKLSPIFLVSGKSGTGKSTVLSALAKKLGIHYWTENCTLIQNSNPAQTESIINNTFLKISSVSPCILHFRYIEALCEDESGNKDDRTVNCFIKNVKQLKSNYPVIIFCTTSQETKLISALQRVFLQTVSMEPLSYESRYSLLNWILKKENIRSENLDEIVRSTSNFVFCDLIQLVSRALKISSLQFDPPSTWKKSNHQFNFEMDLNRCREIREEVFYLTRDHFKKALDEMNEAYANAIGAPEVPNVTWDDIGGLSHLKEETLSSLLQPILPNGLRRSGLLLHGPPGTGKTLLAKAVATECKYNFLSVKGPELLNMYVGQSEKNVREVFSRARESAPCIVFFDELDSLAPKRGQSGGSGSVMDRVVSQLLAEMDGIHKSSGIFMLAATNRPDLIDSALLRPGRLDKMLYVGSCKDAESKLSVLKALTRKFKFSKDVNLEKLVTFLPATREITGADLYGVCSNAWLSAARRHIKKSQNDGAKSDYVSVCSEDMINAISQFKVKDLCLD